jgi:hypothetical protein
MARACTGFHHITDASRNERKACATTSPRETAGASELDGLQIPDQDVSSYKKGTYRLRVGMSNMAGRHPGID